MKNILIIAGAALMLSACQANATTGDATTGREYNQQANQNLSFTDFSKKIYCEVDGSDGSVICTNWHGPEIKCSDDLCEQFATRSLMRDDAKKASRLPNESYVNTIGGFRCMVYQDLVSCHGKNGQGFVIDSKKILN
jgi:hypothetical protein